MCIARKLKAKDFEHVTYWITARIRVHYKIYYILLEYNTMTKLYPNTIFDYIKETEYAVKHLYLGLHNIWSIYVEASTYWDISKLGLEQTQELKSNRDKYLKLCQDYASHNFSEATLCGSLLQIASMAINQYSTNEVIPESCKDILTEKSNEVIKYCIGKEICGLPTGLIIYSARNQYNHWDKELRELNRKVFSKISYENRNNMLADLAYDLGNPTIIVYANEILLGLFHWNTYGIFRNELLEMLNTRNFIK